MAFLPGIYIPQKPRGMSKKKYAEVVKLYLLGEVLKARTRLAKF